MSLLLKVIQDGKITYLPLNEANLIIASQPGTVYTLVNEAGEAVTDNLELLRKEDALEILVNDEPIATLDNFYVASEAQAPATYWVEGPAADMPMGEGFDIAQYSSAHEGSTFISGQEFAAQQGPVWQSGEIMLQAPAAGAATGAAAAESAATAGAATGATASGAAAAGAGAAAGGFWASTPVLVGLGTVGAVGIGAAVSDSSDDSAPDASTSTAGAVSATLAAGTFIAGTKVNVSVYDESGNVLLDENGNKLLNLEKTINDNSQVELGNLSGTVLIVVSNANGTTVDYTDETTGAGKDLGDSTIRAMVTLSGSADTAVTVSPLTELAVALAGVPDEITEGESIAIDTTVNDQVAQLFGLEAGSLTGEVATVDNDDYGDTSTSDNAEAYGEALAMLSGLDSVTGSIDNTIDLLAQNIQDTSTDSTVVNDNAQSGGSGSSNELVLTQGAIKLLEKGVEKFEEGALKDKVELVLNNFITPPDFEIEAAADGGINSSELSNVNITMDVTNNTDIQTTGNVITVYWGNQTEQVTVGTEATLSTVSGKTTLTIPVSQSTILAAGDGYIGVELQVNEGEIGSNNSLVVEVDTTPPVVEGITLSATGAVDKTLSDGDVVSVTVKMSEVANVRTSDGGTPASIDLQIGSETVKAVYASGTGTDELVFNYIISGENTADTDTNGISVVANSLMLNNSTIKDASENAVSTSDLAFTGITDDNRFMVDSTAPAISTVSISADSANLAADDVVTVSVNMNSDTVVNTENGVPSIDLAIGSETVKATYDADASTSTTLVFAYTVSADGTADSGSITVKSDTLVTNGSSIADAVGNDATLTGYALPTDFYSVDTTAPDQELTGIDISNDSQDDSDFITNQASQTIQATMSKALETGEVLKGSVDGGQTWSEIIVATDSTDVSWTTSLADGANEIQLKVVDASGNESTVFSQEYTLDTTAPEVENILLDLDGTDTVIATVIMNEAVSVTGTPVLDLNVEGGTVQATFDSAVSSGDTLVFTYEKGSAIDLSNNPTVASNALTTSLSATGVTVIDAAGNTAATTHDEYIYSTNPIIRDIEFTQIEGAQNGTLNVGDTVTLEVTMSENTTVSGTPFIALTTDNGPVNAYYSGGSGSSVLEFTYTVAEGDNTSSSPLSIAVGSIDLDGGSLIDSDGNAATLTHTVTAMSSYLIDTSAPSIQISNIAISDDSENLADPSVSASDFLTNVTTQTITAELTAAPSSSETLYASIDGGSDWLEVPASNIATANGTTTVTMPGVKLSNSNEIQFKVVDDAGNEGQVATQAYEIDTDAPSVTVSDIEISADTGKNYDFITSEETQTITATLSQALVEGETLYFSKDAGSTWEAVDVTGTAIELTDVVLAGSSSLQFKVQDAAGNDGEVESQAFSIVTQAVNVAITDIAISSDTGDSTDFVTNESTQTITANLDKAIDNGEVLFGSVDGGATWRDITPYVKTENNQTTVEWTKAKLLSGEGRSIQFKVVDIAGNETTPVSQNYTLDVEGPSIADIAISTDSVVTNNTLGEGDVVTVTVTMDDDITVTGTPQFKLQIGDQEVKADYNATKSAADAKTMVFDYTIELGNVDEDGISIKEAAVVLGETDSVKDAVGNDASFVNDAIASNQEFLVDADAAIVTKVEITSDSDTEHDVLNAGDVITVTVTMDEAVTVTGTPTVDLVIGDQTVQATYSASNDAGTELNFTYEIQASDKTDTDGISIPKDSITLGTGVSIIDSIGNNALISHDAVADNADYKVDTTAPTITSAEITGAVIASGLPTLTVGDTISATVTMSEDVIVEGIPEITFKIGSEQVQAVYVASSSSSSELIFKYAISDGAALDGDVSIVENSLTLGTDVSIQDAVGNNATLAHSGSTSSTIDVDTIAPTAFVDESTISLSSDTGASDSDLVTDTASQTITAEISGTIAPTETLMGSIDGGTKWEDVTSKVSGTTLTWDSVTLNGEGTIAFKVVDAAGNVGAESTADYVVDNSSPTVDTMNVDIDGNSVVVTITMSEAVTFTESTSDASTIDIVIDGTTKQVASYDAALTAQAQTAAGSDASILVFTYTDSSAITTQDIEVQENSFTLAQGATLEDIAGNDIAATNSIISHDSYVFSDEPIVRDIEVTATGAENDKLNAGDVITVTVTMSEDITVDTKNGKPTIEIAMATSARDAEYVSTDGNKLVFTYTVDANDPDDASGIGIIENSLELNGATIVDADANNAILEHEPVYDITTLMVDTSSPSVANSDWYATNSSGETETNILNAGDIVYYNVYMTEPVVVDTTNGTPQIDLLIGDTVVTATYDATASSMVGSTELVFSYTILDGQTDTDGISIVANSLNTNGGSITDVAGNNVDLNNAAISSYYYVDTTAPTVTNMSIDVDESTITVLVNVSEWVKDEPDSTGGEVTSNITLTIGSDEVTATYDKTNESGQLVYIYKAGTGNTIDETQEISVKANSLVVNGGTVVDLAGNEAVLTHPDYTYSMAEATVTSPTEYNTVYVNGQNAQIAAIPEADGGGYVAVWQGVDYANSPDHSSTIFVQRYYADGSSDDIATLNGSPNTDDINPDVTALANGSFAVMWQSNTEVFVQQFTYDSSTDDYSQESMVTLNDAVDVENDSHQYQITTLTNGNYVVTWVGQYSDESNVGGNWNIYTQVFDSSTAEPIDMTTEEGTTSAQLTAIDYGDNGAPKTIALTDGSYVVVWGGYATEQDKDTGGPTVLVQQFTYNSTGATFVAGDIEVIPVNSLQSTEAFKATALTDGGYVVTWVDNKDETIFAQKFDASGDKVGSSIEYSESADYNNDVEITALTGGDYVLTWTADDSVGDNDTSIYVQLVKADGTTANRVQLESLALDDIDEVNPVITSLTDGGFVVAYYGEDFDTGETLIFVQQFKADGTTDGFELMDIDGWNSINPVATAPSDSSSGIEDSALTLTALDDGGYVVSWTEFDESSNNYPSTKIQRFYPDGSDWHAYTNADSISVQSTVVGTAYLVNEDVVVTDVASITSSGDTNYNMVQITQADTDTSLSLAGLADGEYKLYTTDANGNLSEAARNEVIIDSTPPVATLSTTLDKASSQVEFGSIDNASITTLVDGSTVVVWNGRFNPNDYSDSVMFQRFDVDGKSSDIMQLTSSTSSLQDVYNGQPEVAALNNGGYVIAFVESKGTQDSDGNWISQNDILVQVYDEDNQQSETPVPIPVAQNLGDIDELSITSLVKDNYVIAWSGESQDNASSVPGEENDWSVYLQLMENGRAVGDAVELEGNYPDSDAGFVDVNALPDGGYVVTWIGQNDESDPDSDAAAGAFMQQFDDEGEAVTGVIELGDVYIPVLDEADYTTDGQFDQESFDNDLDELMEETQPVVQVATFADGTYIAAWAGVTYDSDGSASEYSVSVQQYAADGSIASPVVKAVTSTDAPISQGGIVALDNGGYVATATIGDFTNDAATASDFTTMIFNSNAFTFAADGTFEPNASELNGYVFSKVTPLANGDYVLAAYTQTDSGDEAIATIVYNEDGSIKQDETIIATASETDGEELNDFEITPLNNGGYTILWHKGYGYDTENDNSDDYQQVYTKQFNADGSDSGHTYAMVQSSEIESYALLVHESVTVTDVYSILNADKSLWATAEVEEANTDVKVGLTGLTAGNYVLYVIDDNELLSAPSTNSITVTADMSQPYTADTIAPEVIATIANVEETIIADGRIHLVFDEEVEPSDGVIVISATGHDDIVIRPTNESTDVNFDGAHVDFSLEGASWSNGDPVEGIVLESGTTYNIGFYPSRDSDGKIIDGTSPFMDTSGNLLATDGTSNFSLTIDDTVVVRFNLNDGEVTSSDADTFGTFQADTTYQIELYVDSYAENIEDITPWTGGENLGSDDKYVLIGSGSPVSYDGDHNHIVNDVNVDGNEIMWNASYYSNGTVTEDVAGLYVTNEGAGNQVGIFREYDKDGAGSTEDYTVLWSGVPTSFPEEANIGYVDDINNDDITWGDDPQMMSPQS